MQQNKLPKQNRLVLYRRRMELSQKRVAHLLGHRDSSTLSVYESGRVLPPLVTALRLAIVLRVPVEFLFPALYEELRTGIRQEEERTQDRPGVSIKH